MRPYGQPAQRIYPLVGKQRKESLENNICPQCGNTLDEGWECDRCGYEGIKEATDGR